MGYGAEKDRDAREALPAAPNTNREVRGRGAPGPETEVLIGKVMGPADPPRGGSELVLAQRPPGDRHPAVVYLASLSEGSRRSMRASLENKHRPIPLGRRGRRLEPRLARAPLRAHRLREVEARCRLRPGHR